jgi:glycerophosphoryl diester phosphodiesterase
MPARPLVIAHRGSCGGEIRENTLASFGQAVALGAEMIELDVRRTVEGELVVFHDGEVAGRTVGSLTLQTLRQQAGTEVPRLTDVLDWAAGRVALDVELKEDGYVEQVAEPLVAFASGGGELLVTSFVEPVLAALSRLRTSPDCGLLIGFEATGAVGRALRCGAGALVVQAELVSDALIDEAVGAGLELFIWDFMVATPGHAELLRDRRVAGVITDDVPGALAARA